MIPKQINLNGPLNKIFINCLNRKGGISECKHTQGKAKNSILEQRHEGIFQNNRELNAIIHFFHFIFTCICV